MRENHWTPALVEYAMNNFRLDLYGEHGIGHWARVKHNADLLCNANPALDRKVMHIFAIMHDSERVNEFEDYGHGSRAAKQLINLNGHLFDLTQAQLMQCVIACDRHTGAPANDPIASPTILACWDADRLDIGRVGLRPHERYLSHPHSKHPNIIDQAYRRSLRMDAKTYKEALA